MMLHCTGSVSWNSSTSTTRKRSRSRRATSSPPGPLERRVEPRQQVVVGHDAGALLAAVELAPHRVGEAGAHRRRAALLGARRLDRRERVGDRDRRDPARLLARERRRAVGTVEAADVEVVDDLVDQVGHVLDERGVALDVARHAEPAQHLLAEPVRGGDRRRVEVGDRARQALVPERIRLRGEVGHQTLAHPLAQLAGRHPRERDEQESSRAACPRPRSATASAAIVHVLPVPALASSTVTPVGSGPQTSNVGHRRSCLQDGVPQPPRPAAEAARLVDVPALVGRAPPRW